MCAGRAGAVPGKKRVPGKFRERFREPVPMGSKVWIGCRVPSLDRFQGSEVWIGFQGSEVRTGSKVPRLGYRFQGSRFQEPVPRFRGYRFQVPRLG